MGAWGPKEHCVPDAPRTVPSLLSHQFHLGSHSPGHLEMDRAAVGWGSEDLPLEMQWPGNG